MLKRLMERDPRGLRIVPLTAPLLLCVCIEGHAACQDSTPIQTEGPLARSVAMRDYCCLWNMNEDYVITCSGGLEKC